MDSLAKNHGASYAKHFERRLVDAFCRVFAATDDVSARMSLHKLRITWQTTFDAKTLFELDSAVKKHLDPKWPVVPFKGAKGETAKIHINPAVFNRPQVMCNTVAYRGCHNNVAIIECHSIQSGSFNGRYRGCHYYLNTGDINFIAYRVPHLIGIWSVSFISQYRGYHCV